MKRGSNGSAFICCDSCNKDIPAATADMHDCKQDEKTKAVLVKMAVEIPVSGRGPLKEKNGTTPVEKSKRKADTQTFKKTKKPAKLKDKNEPKRPPTAFFLFMEEFRKTFKVNNPVTKGVAEVAKCCGEKWKAMSDEEKASFLQRAADLKENYQRSLKAFKDTKKIVNGLDEMEVMEKSVENGDIADKDDAF